MPQGKYAMVIFIFGLLLLHKVQAQTTMVYEAIPSEYIKAEASSSLPAFPVSATLGMGLNRGLHQSDNLGRTMWISEVSTELQQAQSNTKKGVVWLKYGFDKVRSIDRLHIWNHNQHNHLNRGLQKVFIQYSLDGIKWESLKKKGKDYFIIPKSSGKDGSEADFELNFSGLRFKYLCITADKLQGNYYQDQDPQTLDEARLNNQNIHYYGLSEVRFYQKKNKDVAELPVISEGSFEVNQGYLKSAEGPCREFYISLNEPLFTGGTIEVSFNGKNKTERIPVSEKGIYNYSMTFPPGMMEEKEQVNFSFKSLQGNFKKNMEVPGARKWEIHFLPHSHLDIGYTHTHEEVLERQLRNIDLAMELIKTTEAFPKASRFRWNIETVWPLITFKERYHGTGKWQQFKKYVQSGSIGLNASLGNILTGISKQEELMHLFDDGIELAKSLGVPLHSVMMSDVPGFSWGLVTAMAENGLKYFSMAPNYVPYLLTGGSRVGLSHIEWANRPFYWQSQSLQEEILCWSAGTGYSYFHDWLVGPLSSSGVAPLMEELENLEIAGFPYGMTYFRYTVNGDNGPPDRKMSDLIRTWNETYSSPQFVISTTEALFSEFEARYSEHIPRFKGDFTPYWEDGAASTAATLAMNRTNSDKLNQLEILWTLNNLQDFPFSTFQKTWRNIILFSEHTWGASASGTAPNAPLTQKLWRQKERFALRADSLTREIDSALRMKFTKGKSPKYIQVFNTNLHPRSDVVQLKTGMDLSGVVLRDEVGSIIPLQSMGEDRWIFIASNIEPLSSKVYSIDRSGEMNKDPGFEVTPLGMSNGKIEITIDPESGAISELLTRNGKNYAGKGGLNMYIFSGRNLQDVWTNDSVTSIKTLHKGPVATTLRVSSTPKGTNGLFQDITLYNGLSKIDITNRMDKATSLEFENIRFAFPFKIENPETEIDLAFSMMRPEREQLSGANKNFYSMNNGVAITGLEHSVLLANTDSPILEVGSMSGESWLDDPIEFLSWKRQGTSSSTVYSWVMNNSWMTNYKRSQKGEASFRYSIIPLEGDSDHSKLKSLEIAQPLIAIISSMNKPLQSLFTLKGNHQIAVSTLRPTTDGAGYIVRLANMSGRSIHTAFEWGRIKPKEIYECSNQEKIIQQIDDQSFWLHPYGTKTLKLEI